MYYAKQKARFVKYRIYKNFSNYKFRRDMSKVFSLSNLQKDEFDSFKYLVFALLDSQAHLTISSITTQNGLTHNAAGNEENHKEISNLDSLILAINLIYLPRWQLYVQS